METSSAPNAGLAQQIAMAAAAFHRKRTGHAPKSVSVVLGADTLVITLHDALSPAEKSLARTKEGAAQVQKFHREVFTASSEPLRREINRITGVEVQEANAELQTTSGAVVQIFTTGSMVQVFQLGERVPTDTWYGDESDQ